MTHLSPTPHPLRRWRFLRNEAGNMTTSFVLTLPIIFGLFLLTLDTGFATMRAALLERSLDVTARSLRAGTISPPSIANIRTDLCSRLTFFKDCNTMLKVQIVAVSRPGFTTPSRALACADQGASLTAVRGFVAGQDNPLAVLRACMDVTTFTPAALLPNRPLTYRIHSETVIAGRAL